MSVPPRAELEKLLDDDRWIRRLALRLVADPGTAEDLVQETWAAAVSARGAAVASAERRWLGRILRNAWKDLLRSRERRDRREQAAAREEATPPADELVAELELRERIAGALRTLGEPERSALFLRFFRDESLASIARQQGVAVSTVHERVERGLARLRARLDGAHGGRREAWAGALITLATRAGKGAGTIEVLTMAGALKVAVSVLVLGGGVAWWWSGQRPEALTPPAAVAGPLAAGRAPTSTPLVGEAPGREPIAAAPATTAGPRDEPGPRLVAGHVYDVHGRGIGDVELGWKDALPAGEPARSRADGSFELPLGERHPVGQDRIVSRSPDLVTLVSTDASAGRTVVVAPRASFAGTVVDQESTPVPGVEVSFRLRETLFREVGLHAWSRTEEGWSTTSDARGRFALADVAGGANVFLGARLPGFAYGEAELEEGGSETLVITLHRAGGQELTGVVLDPAGAPLPGARVSAGKTIVQTDVEGRFTLLWDGGNGNHFEDESGAIHEQGIEHATLIAMKEGLLPAAEPLRERDLALPFLLRLGPAPLSIRGTVVDAEGQPVPGVIVWVPELTRFGHVLEPLPDGTEMPRDLSVEAEVSADGEPVSLSAADGAFELRGLMQRSYSVSAFDPRTASRAGPWTIEAGAENLRLVFTLEPTRRVAGRVVSAEGRPRGGMTLEPRRELRPEAAAPQLHGSRYGVETDVEGRFEFERLAVAGTSLFVSGHYVFDLIELAAFHDLEHLEIVAPELCEVQIELSDPSLASLVRALDADGNRLETMEVTGNAQMVAVSMAYEATLVDGRSRLLMIKETARTLLLSQGEVEVLRLPIRLDPDRRTVLRP